jgi:hypothetical protein
MAPSSTICSALGNDPIPINSATSIRATTPANDTQPRLSRPARSSVLYERVPHPLSPRNAYAYASMPTPDQNQLRTSARVRG